MISMYLPIPECNQDHTDMMKGSDFFTQEEEGTGQSSRILIFLRETMLIQEGITTSTSEGGMDHGLVQMINPDNKGGILK